MKPIEGGVRAVCLTNKGETAISKEKQSLDIPYEVYTEKQHLGDAEIRLIE